MTGLESGGSLSLTKQEKEPGLSSAKRQRGASPMPATDAKHAPTADAPTADATSAAKPPTAKPPAAAPFTAEPCVTQPAAAEASPSDSKPVRTGKRACFECHRAKAACEGGCEGEPCNRCVRLGKQCIPHERKKRGRRKVPAAVPSAADPTAATSPAAYNPASNPAAVGGSVVGAPPALAELYTASEPTPRSGMAAGTSGLAAGTGGLAADGLAADGLTASSLLAGLFSPATYTDFRAQLPQAQAVSTLPNPHVAHSPAPAPAPARALTCAFLTNLTPLLPFIPTKPAHHSPGAPACIATPTITVTFTLP